VLEPSGARSAAFAGRVHTFLAIVELALVVKP
jgi:hypothetical protein